MDIPPEVLITISLEQGTVCHFEIEIVNHDGTKYKGERFFIILNVNPKTDELLVLTTITKQIESQRQYVKKNGQRETTLVTITPKEFPKLKHDSVVNCNNIYELTKGELIKNLRKGKFFFDKLPKSTVDALIAGVLTSTVVTRSQQQLVI